MLIASILIIIYFISLSSERVKLSKNQNGLTLVKFITALCVVNGHLFAFNYDGEFLRREMNIGALCVSLFFFLSAYGLYCSYTYKQDYLKNFLSKRLSAIILPFVVAYIISLLVYYLFEGSINWKNVLATLAWGGPYMKFSWYVTEILFIYILFYVCFKYGRTERQRVLSLIVSIALLIIILIFLRQPVWYIQSLPAFIIGIIYAKYEPVIVSYKRKAIQRMVFIPLACVGLAFLLRWELVGELNPALGRWRWYYLSFFVSNIVFALIIPRLLSSKIKISNTRFISCFYEVYLLQNASMIIAQHYSSDFWSYWVISMLICYCSSLLVFQFDKYFIRLVTSRI